MAKDNISTKKLPSAFDLFKPSFEIIKNNLVAFLVLAGIPLAFILIGQGPDLFSSSYRQDNSSMYSGWDWFSIIGLILTIITAPGVILLQLKGVKKQNIDYKAAFKQGAPFILRLLGLGIVLLLMLTVAFLLLIVPFFILLPRIVLAPYYLIDRNMGIIESIKKSMSDYKKHKGTWGVIGVQFLISLTGNFPFIGTLLSSALAFIYAPAFAIRYTQIKMLSEGKVPKATTEESK